MGYVKHNAVIVTGWMKQDIEDAHKKAKEVYDRCMDATNTTSGGSCLVSEIIKGVVNNQYSFFIAPDGSKEGWPDSNKSDDARTEFLNWIQSSGGYADYIEIRFGGDDETETIERSRQKEIND